MRHLSLAIFLTCFACIAGSSIAIPAMTLTPRPTQTHVAPTATQETQKLGTFTIIADLVYIRDREGEVTTREKYYFKGGEIVSCYLTDSGWCMLDNGTKVWSGCLSPNPLDLGCEAR